MTDVDTLARIATSELLDHSRPDVPMRCAELKRIRVRRTAAKLVTLGVAVALGVGSWQLANGSRDRHDTRPVAPVHLHLDEAVSSQPEVVATTRTTQRGDQVDYDRFDGVTEDGLLVRQRYTYEGDLSEFGLLDPATGNTDWLPRPPWDLGGPQPLELSADHIAYLDSRHAGEFSVLTFDRRSRVWQGQVFPSPPGVDRFFGFTALFGDDDRVYLLDPGPSVRWFSIGPGESEMRAEPELSGQQVAFSRTARITADDTGRVVVTRLGEPPEVVENRLPAGCRLREGLPGVALAGDRAVVTLPCLSHPVLMVFDSLGRLYLTIDSDLTVSAAGPSHLLLTNDIDLFSLDLDQRQLSVIDGPLHDALPAGSELVGDLAVWDEVGPRDGQRVYDAVWKAARVP